MKIHERFVPIASDVPKYPGQRTTGKCTYVCFVPLILTEIECLRTMKSILTKEAPAPAGHYAQAIVHNDLVFVSGQLPIDPQTGEKRLHSIEDQTRQVLFNLAAILNAAGSSKENVLKVTVYISDIELWDRVNTVYAAFFHDHRPARAVVPTRELHFGFQIEMEAIAALR